MPTATPPAPITAPLEEGLPEGGVNPYERMRDWMAVVGPRDAAEEDAKRKKAEAKRAPVEPPDGKTAKTLAVYVCPMPECKDYYGAIGMGDLAVKKTYPPTEHVFALQERTGQGHLHSRSVCPTCKANGVTAEDGSPIERVLVAARVLV